MTLDLTDIQGNILRGYRIHYARHFALGVADPAGAARLIGLLVSGNEQAAPQVTTAAEWKERPKYFLNVGITWAGLERLGLPAPLLQLFPEPFRQGPAARADKLGDKGDAAPANWILGGPGTPAVHLILSLYTDQQRTAERDALTAQLRALFAANGVTEISVHDAAALPGGKVHFGYRDGIAQPRINGTPGRPARPDMQPVCDPGEFLLGKDYVNQFGGNFLGDLPNVLGDNGTYSAFRILRQDVAGFEAFLTKAAAHYGFDREMVAAKLLGRWRNGVPLTLSPDASEPAPPLSEERLNDFDYGPSKEYRAFYDDRVGLRCPVGAHIRRLNPRSSVVMGKPHSRRIIRRGVAYGPVYDPAAPDGTERGLMGHFLCGDLAMQFEFLLGVWVNQDLSTAGLRGTRDPMLGAQAPDGGQFVIRTADHRDPVVLDDLPRFVITRGSVYGFIPGIGALRFLASL
jgi:deferrochelatase/peroxidase EfeB